MVKRPIVIAALTCSTLIIVGGGLFLLLRTPPDRDAAKAFFGTPQKYDMTHGQEMRPRW